MQIQYLKNTNLIVSFQNLKVCITDYFRIDIFCLRILVVNKNCVMFYETADVLLSETKISTSSTEACCFD